MPRLIRFLSTTVLGLAVFAAWPTTAAPKPSANNSLDEELLEDLKDEMPDKDGAAEKDPEPAPRPAKPAEPPDRVDKPLDEQLLEDLEDPHAEDDAQDPLQRVGQKMRKAQGLIARRQSGGETQKLQHEIVAEIDKLLKEAARKQSSSKSPSSSKQQASKREQASQPSQPASAGGQGQASNNPARDSDARMQDRRAERPDPQTTRDLMQELWGHLPERERQQVLQTPMETFVPKYELMIKEYFKRLAETARERETR